MNTGASSPFVRSFSVLSLERQSSVVGGGLSLAVLIGNAGRMWSIRVGRLDHGVGQGLQIATIPIEKAFQVSLLELGRVQVVSRAAFLDPNVDFGFGVGPSTVHLVRDNDRLGGSTLDSGIVDQPIGTLHSFVLEPAGSFVDEALGVCGGHLLQGLRHELSAVLVHHEGV